MESNSLDTGRSDVQCRIAERMSRCYGNVAVSCLGAGQHQRRKAETFNLYEREVSLFVIEHHCAWEPSLVVGSDLDIRRPLDHVRVRSEEVRIDGEPTPSPGTSALENVELD